MSSAYAIQAPSAIYREEQRFGLWVYGLVALILILGWSFIALQKNKGAAVGDGPIDSGRIEFSVGVTLGLAIPATLILGVLKMTTEVHPTDVRIWFGWIPTYRRIVPVADIKSIEIVRYRPIRDCRGWGIRTGPGGERVLSARGEMGVRLTFTDGSKLLIGTQKPEPLALAIEGTLEPSA